MLFKGPVNATANFTRQCRDAEASARRKPGYAAVAYVSDSIRSRATLAQRRISA